MAAALDKPALTPPRGADAIWAAGWTAGEGRQAVDLWKRGYFAQGWQLILDVTGHPGIKAAEGYRLASPCGLPWSTEGPDRAPARFETEAAKALWLTQLQRLLRSTLRDVAMGGFSVWHHPIVVDPETLRASCPEVKRWPLSAVGYTPDPIGGVVGYYAITRGGQRVQLPKPGTTVGEWTVVGEGDQPHALDAAITALDMAFTSGMLSWRARANLGKTAGRASPVGYMPKGFPVNSAPDADGNAVHGPGEAAAETLAGIGTEHEGALFPFEFKLDKFELTTTGAAEFFHQDLLDTLLLVMLAVIGRGGGLAKTDAQYQGPTEMDVPESLVRRDVGIFERAATGLFEMLARMNAGPDVETPRLDGHLPDADQEQRIQDYGKRRAAYIADLAAEKAIGIPLTQEHADALAKKYRVESVVLPAAAPPSAEIFAYDLEGGVLTRGTAAELKGLPPPPRPELTVPEFRALTAAPPPPQGAPATPTPATASAPPANPA